VNLSQYINDLQALLGRIDTGVVDEIASRIRKADRVYIVGNGGSMATAMHLAEDLLKCARVRAAALCDLSLLTAYANDCGYESSFDQTLSVLADSGDLVVAISASGNSENVLRAVRACSNSVGLTGFDGGRLKDVADVAVVVPSDNIRMVEDAHLVICHMIVTRLADGQ